MVPPQASMERGSCLMYEKQFPNWNVQVRSEKSEGRVVPYGPRY